MRTQTADRSRLSARQSLRSDESLSACRLPLRRRSSGFTLIEMLLVIFIIVLLAGLILGGIAIAMRKAEFQKAQATAFQLATAFRSYQSMFGTWPNSVTGPQDVDDALISKLVGSNPRQITFLEVEPKYWTNDVNGTKGYCDPWHRLYRCQFDQTYQGVLSNVANTGSASLPVGVVVWSVGPTNSSNAADWPKTW